MCANANLCGFALFVLSQTLRAILESPGYLLSRIPKGRVRKYRVGTTLLAEPCATWIGWCQCVRINCLSNQLVTAIIFE